MALVHLREKDVSPRTLFAQFIERIAEGDQIEAVLIAYREDGCWKTTWTSTTRGGLAMGAMKMFRDISDTLGE